MATQDRPGLWLPCLLGLFVACGSQEAGEPNVLFGSDGQPAAPAWQGGAPEIVEPAAPDLPPCLQGDSPAGCAAVPQLESWTCPIGWSSQQLGEGEPWQHSICAPPELPECPDAQIAWLDDPVCQPVGTAWSGWKTA